MRVIRGILAMAMAGGIGATASAQTAGRQNTATLDPFAQMVATRGVADYARRHGDAQAMLTAARMLSEIPMTGQVEAGPGFDPAGLFAEARTLAAGDAALLQRIRIAETTDPRGVTSSNFGKGLVRSVQVVAPRASYRFSVNARAGEPLRLGAIGELGTTLTMRVLDKAGRVICLDDQGDYAPVCQTRPAADGAYRVDIVNTSAARSRTVILSN